MEIVVVAAACVALVLGAFASLARTVARDGYGSRPAPRSHVEEVGSWVEQELQR